MEGECGVSRSIIDERHSWYIQGGQVEGEAMVLLEVSLMNFILQISNEIKLQVKKVLLKVSLMNFIFGYPRRSNGRLKWCYSKYH